MPPDGLNIRWPDDRFAQEARLLDFKLRAVTAFARRNPLDRALYARRGARIGIVTSGEAYSDVREALDELGIDERRAGQLGAAPLI
jgi:indolepyruvate ferredoxin oxidoreductase